jgi:uncharacterized protein YsxB (DUF464 family)
MTTIEFSSVGGATKVAITGHAGFAEHGKDIVCAAVSITAQALAATLSTTDGVMCDVTKEDGRMVIILRHAARIKRYVDALLDMARTAFEMIAETYPDHVTIK